MFRTRVREAHMLVAARIGLFLAVFALATLSRQKAAALALPPIEPRIPLELPSFPVYLTYSPPFPLAERPLAGQPFTYNLSATVDPDGVPLTPGKLTGPTWQWSVRATYSDSFARPFVEPLSGSWSHRFSSPNDPATSVTFTSQARAYWRFTVIATARYRDNFGHTWIGRGEVTLCESTWGAPIPPFTITRESNADGAVRDEFTKQIQPAAVLQGRRVKYEAPGADVTQWQYRRVEETTWEWFRKDGQVLQGNPVYANEREAGEFEVRYARGTRFDQFSKGRRIRVVEPHLLPVRIPTPVP